MVSGKVSDHKKCIKQLALNVAKNAKFHSSLPKVSLFFAENATERKEGSNSADS